MCHGRQNRPWWRRHSAQRKGQTAEKEMLGGTVRQSREPWRGRVCPSGAVLGEDSPLRCCSALSRAWTKGYAEKTRSHRGKVGSEARRQEHQGGCGYGDIRGVARAHACVTFPYKSQINSRINESAAQSRGFSTSKEAKRHLRVVNGP